MKTTEGLSPFEARLLDELKARVEPLAEAPAPSAGWRSWAGVPTIRSRPRLVLGLVAMAVGLVVAVPSIVAPERSPAFAVTQLPDGRVHVTVTPDFDQSERLRRELAEAGVDVKIERLAAHPRLVGTIELLPLGHGGISAAGAEGLEFGKGEFWIDPSRYRGSVELLIYASADRGQSWQAAPSIFHPDEPLGGLLCTIDGALDTATLERYATQVGITRFEWLSQSGLTERTSKRPDGHVVAASMKSPHELRVIVSPVGQAGAAPRRPSMDLGLHTRQEPACTPELAARWR